MEADQENMDISEETCDTTKPTDKSTEDSRSLLTNDTSHTEDTRTDQQIDIASPKCNIIDSTDDNAMDVDLTNVKSEIKSDTENTFKNIKYDIKIEKADFILDNQYPLSKAGESSSEEKTIGGLELAMRNDEQAENASNIVDQSEDVTNLVDQLEEMSNVMEDLENISNVFEQSQNSGVKSAEVSNAGGKSEEVSNAGGISEVVSNAGVKSQEFSKAGGKSETVSNIIDQSKEVSNTEGKPVEVSNAAVYSEEIPNTAVQPENVLNIINQSEEVSNIVNQSEEVSTIVKQLKMDPNIVNQSEIVTGNVDQSVYVSSNFDQSKRDSTAVDKSENDLNIGGQSEEVTNSIRQSEKVPDVVEESEPVSDDVSNVVKQTEEMSDFTKELVVDSNIVEQSENVFKHVDQSEKLSDIESNAVSHTDYANVCVQFEKISNIVNQLDLLSNVVNDSEEKSVKLEATPKVVVQSEGISNLETTDVEMKEMNSSKPDDEIEISSSLKATEESPVAGCSKSYKDTPKILENDRSHAGPLVDDAGQDLDEMATDVHEGLVSKLPETSMEVETNSEREALPEVQGSDISIITPGFPSAVPSSSANIGLVLQEADEGLPEEDTLGLLAEAKMAPLEEEEEEEEEDDDISDDHYGEDSNQMQAEGSDDNTKTMDDNEESLEGFLKLADNAELQEEVDLGSEEQLLDPGKDSEFEADDSCAEKELEKMDEDVGEQVELEGDSPLVPELECISSGILLQATSLAEPAATDVQERSTPSESEKPAPEEQQKEVSPKVKKPNLQISKSKNVMDIVDLQESSSDSDGQLSMTAKKIKKDSDNLKKDSLTTPPVRTDVEMPMAKPDNQETKATEQVVRASEAKSTPEARETAPEKKSPQKPKFSLEVFSLDSDEEEQSHAQHNKRSPQKPDRARKSPKGLESSAGKSKKSLEVQLPEAKRESQVSAPEGSKSCINNRCSRTSSLMFPASSFVISCYSTRKIKKRKQYVCEKCSLMASERMQKLIDGFVNMDPLVDMDIGRELLDVVEISDSDTDTEDESVQFSYGEKLSQNNVRLLEEELENALNKTWDMYQLEEQLDDCRRQLNSRIQNLSAKFNVVESLFASCQGRVDRMRNSLYLTFKSKAKEVAVLDIVDTKDEFAQSMVTIDEEGNVKNEPVMIDSAQPTQSSYSLRPMRKQKFETLQDVTAVKSMESDLAKQTNDDKKDEDMPTEVQTQYMPPPPWLPEPGEMISKSLAVGDVVYAVRGTTFGAWGKGQIVQLWPKGTVLNNHSSSMFTLCRVKFVSKNKSVIKLLTGRQLAYPEPINVPYKIGARVIAVFKDSLMPNKGDAYYSGVIAELPTPINQYRYLVFFDDGYAQYVAHPACLMVCENSDAVWQDVHPDSRDFVRNYLRSYPERPMVRLMPGQALKTEWNGKWCMSRVMRVDASLVLIQFEDGRKEWIYRGSTRLAPLFLELQAAGRHRIRRNNRTVGLRANMPYVEYTRTEGEDGDNVITVDDQDVESSPVQKSAAPQQNEQQQQRAVAKKSSTGVAQHNVHQTPIENVMSRVVYYSPKAAVKPFKMVAHRCNVDCRRVDVLPLKELKHYNPLARPLLTGWERQICRFKGRKIVCYRAPCGRRLRNMPEVHQYLTQTRSDCTVDLFDFDPATHCLAEFVINKYYVSKKDLSNGVENVPVPCVNYYDTSLPEFCQYNTVRTPTVGVPLNLDEDFLCGCDCKDDCRDKSKCACWKLTMEGARTIGFEGDVGYEYRRLLEPLLSGIYECNSRCKCASSCLNRVVQHPLQLKLQVFKTLNRGWGIRALNDVPRGAFVCIYAGNLLTDATANMDGIKEGDEYLAELDYIEVVERMKEGYESDVPEDLLKDTNREDKSKKDQDENDELSEEEGEEQEDSKADEDADFKPVDWTEDQIRDIGEIKKRLRRRKKDDKKSDEAVSTGSEDQTEQFITISDDEEVREPSSLAAQANLEKDDYVPKYRSVRSFFGEDEDCYIMDAKVQGNLGRYLNHSCMPNVFVQNVFVDTHDPRFPWVAFFSLNLIRAGTELTWNYNYDVGSVAGKVMYCKCGAPNCRGRLL